MPAVNRLRQTDKKGNPLTLTWIVQHQPESADQRFMEVIGYALRLQQLLERDADRVEVAVDALPENVHSAYCLAQCGGRSPQRLREEPVLLNEDERGEVGDQHRKMRFAEDVAAAGHEPLRLEDVNRWETGPTLVLEKQVFEEGVDRS